MNSMRAASHPSKPAITGRWSKRMDRTSRPEQLLSLVSAVPGDTHAVRPRPEARTKAQGIGRAGRAGQVTPAHLSAIHPKC